MALGKRCNSMKYRRTGEERLGFEFVKYTRSFGRKRILISNNDDILSLEDDDSTLRTPLKRLCSLEPEKSTIESLPQDILIKILCNVDHDDLKQLFHVSTAIREATMVAKKSHFAYSTPKKTPAFRTQIDFGNPTADEIEPPNAPRLRSYRSRLNGSRLAELSVALFSSPKKQLFSKSETTVM